MVSTPAASVASIPASLKVFLLSRWDVFRTLLSERETSSRYELLMIQQLSIFPGLRSPESQVFFSCRTRLEGKVPSFVSGLLFLQHPAETRHRLDPSTAPLRGFPAGLSARRPPRDAAVWLLDTSLEKTDPEHQGGAFTVLLGLVQGFRTNEGLFF